MRSPRLIGTLIGLAGCLLLVAGISERTEENQQRERDLLVTAVDDLWLQAMHVGADPDRWPKVEFLTNIGSDLARTRCDRPQPTIMFNDDLLTRYRWYFQNMTVAHEMGHVMVCLDGKADEQRDPHGEHWENWVRLLVPRDESDDIIAEQHAAAEERL